MKISTKQNKGHTLLTEQIFADDLHIGLIVRSIFSSTASIRAYYVKNGSKAEIGMFSGNFARRDAKTAIIQRHINGKN